MGDERCRSGRLEFMGRARGGLRRTQIWHAEVPRTNPLMLRPYLAHRVTTHRSAYAMPRSGTESCHAQIRLRYAQDLSRRAVARWTILLIKLWKTALPRSIVIDNQILHLLLREGWRRR
ncbi:hypothetical protein CR513_10253, partial [Mucuna pruriens]